MNGAVEGFHRASGHSLHGCAAAFHRNGGNGQQVLIQHADFLLSTLGFYRKAGKLFQQAAERHEQEGAKHIEGCMHNGDSHFIRRLVHKVKMKNCIRTIEQGKQHSRADDVEIKMYHCGAFCAFRCIYRGEQRRDAGSDVLPHNDGDGDGIGNRSGGRKRLQDANRGRRRLYDSGKQRACKHAEKRVGKQQKEVCKLRNVPEAAYRAGHFAHAGHEHRKAQQNHAGILFLWRLAEQVKHNSDECKHRGKGRWLKQGDEKA